MPADAPPNKLYGPWSIGAAAAGGGIFAGALMMALNYRSLGQADYFWQTLALGMAANVLVMICFMYTGAPAPEVLEWLLRFLQGGVVAFIAHKLQGDALEQHGQLGGQTSSLWQTIGVAFAGILILWLTTLMCVVCLETSKMLLHIK